MVSEGYPFEKALEKATKSHVSALLKDTGLNSQVDDLIKTLVDSSSPLACLLRQEIKTLSEVYSSALSDSEDEGQSQAKSASLVQQRIRLCSFGLSEEYDTSAEERQKRAAARRTQFISELLQQDGNASSAACVQQEVQEEDDEMEKEGQRQIPPTRDNKSDTQPNRLQEVAQVLLFSQKSLQSNNLAISLSLSLSLSLYIVTKKLLYTGRWALTNRSRN